LDEPIRHPSEGHRLFSPLSSTERIPGAKAVQLLLTWAAALVLSALLVWCGRHWPLPLLEQSWALRRPERPVQIALALVLMPPLLLGLVLLRGLLRHPTAPAAHPDRGESSD
jgi:type VI protein secretion system component VasK